MSRNVCCSASMAIVFSDHGPDLELLDGGCSVRQTGYGIDAFALAGPKFGGTGGSGNASVTFKPEFPSATPSASSRRK